MPPERSTRPSAAAMCCMGTGKSGGKGQNQLASEPVLGPRSLLSPYHVEAIDVMHVLGAPSPHSAGHPEHGDLRTVEHRRLVHVIPDIEVGSRALRTQGGKWEQRTEG